MPGSVVLTNGAQWRSEQMRVSRGFSKALECEGQRGFGQKKKVHCALYGRGSGSSVDAARLAGGGRGAPSPH